MIHVTYRGASEQVSDGAAWRSAASSSKTVLLPSLLCTGRRRGDRERGRGLTYASSVEPGSASLTTASTLSIAVRPPSTTWPRSSSGSVARLLAPLLPPTPPTHGCPSLPTRGGSSSRASQRAASSRTTSTSTSPAHVRSTTCGSVGSWRPEILRRLAAPMPAAPRSAGGPPVKRPAASSSPSPSQASRPAMAPEVVRPEIRRWLAAPRPTASRSAGGPPVQRPAASSSSPSRPSA